MICQVLLSTYAFIQEDIIFVRLVESATTRQCDAIHDLIKGRASSDARVVYFVEMKDQLDPAN